MTQHHVRRAARHLAPHVVRLAASIGLDAALSTACALTVAHTITPIQGSAPAHDTLQALYPPLRAELKHATPQLISAVATLPTDHPEILRADLLPELLQATTPADRRRAGVYFTPAPVAAALVRGVDAALRCGLDLPLGLADTSTWGQLAAKLDLPVPASVSSAAPFISVLDPAVGGGAFLLAALAHIEGTLRARWALNFDARWPDYVRDLVPRLMGQDISQAALTVCAGRLALALRASGVESKTLALTLADTLSASHRSPPASVILANPPFRRLAAGEPRLDATLLAAYTDPVRAAGDGVHLKNLHNLYAYFWRWATAHTLERGPGVVGLVTPTSWIAGPAFPGLRAHSRSHCDRAWVLDLGGARRSAQPTDNLFPIASPTCATVMMRRDLRRAPADVYYHRAPDGADDKRALCRAADLAALPWRAAAPTLTAPWMPSHADWSAMPQVTALFPFQTAGIQLKRTWPIAPDPPTLRRRWRALLVAPDRGAALRETAVRRAASRVRPLPHQAQAPPLSTLGPDAPPPPIEPYAHRAFDHRWLLADARLGDRMRPKLWAAHGPKQRYLISLWTGELGRGPAVLITRHRPDLHLFRGAYGGRDVLPLWLDADATQPNVAPGLLQTLSTAYARPVHAEALFTYTFALLSAPSYTARFEAELRTPGPRLPITADGDLFAQISTDGAALMALHLKEPARHDTTPIEPTPSAWHHTNGVLNVGAHAVSLSPAAWALRISGRAVVQRWLEGRLKVRGRRSSALDDLRPTWTTATVAALHHLCATLDETTRQHPRLDALLTQVMDGARLNPL